ncbi:VRR-NUC domain-containing protein [Aquirufa aurantiipilula]|uniref:VRR-NUC domain-containing protein n=1 Tax=Aquirufa aurantiipilula TaxID=2696561 RepID=UPI001CAA5E15|nr:VRR-NUC domain-containing protein [Aquirufa aurantiipilula]MBZ1327548.1 VRR-NUC domain-containing protein [Aquirufa aurantiipilula]
MDNSPIPNLSPTYYWDYFQYVLRYVTKHYAELLDENERTFIHDFETSSFAAQCLYLRLASRRTIWFQEDLLQYPEIPSLEDAKRELFHLNLLERIGQTEGQSAYACLANLNKAICFDLIQIPGQKSPVPKSVSKPVLLQYILENLREEELLLRLEQLHISLIRPLQTTYFHFIQFLFFGSRNHDLTDFVVRDLGHRQFIDIDEADLVPYFSNREEAIQKWRISIWREWFFEKSKEENAVEEVMASWQANMWPLVPELLELCIGSFERTLFHVARWLERQGELEMALSLYEESLAGASLERRVRLLLKLKRIDEAMMWARTGLELISNPKERHFFEDFLLKQASKKQIKQVTASLKEAEKLAISMEWKDQVEEGVVDYFRNQGYYAAFTENRVWKNLMGLWFWELIFQQNKSGFHHPFQYAPSHYARENFAIDLADEFRTYLNLIEDEGSWWELMKQNAEKNQGKMNPLVDWQNLDFDLLQRLVHVIPKSSLLEVVSYMWHHLATHSKGFPDLFIQKGEEYAFIEVKSPNDHLSAIQYFWHDFFRQQEIAIRLIRVEWV